MRCGTILMCARSGLLLVKNEARRCTCPETLMANLMSHRPRCEYETLPLPLCLCLCLLQSTPVKNSAEYMKSFVSEIFPTFFLSLSLSLSLSLCVCAIYQNPVLVNRIGYEIFFFFFFFETTVCDQLLKSANICWWWMGA
jgi:hypothetical protein